MSLSDTFYVALCMTVLIVGVVYWFWTQNQYIQRKLNLLENIVYEMKTSLNAASAPDGIGGIAMASSAAAESDLKPAVYPPAPGSELGEDDDLLFEELHEDKGVAAVESEHPTELPSLSLSSPKEENIIEAFSSSADYSVSADDLLPGGSAIKEIPLDAESKSSVLDSMTLKELRRLAEQKGVSNVKALKKPELIAAIRLSKVSVTPFEVSDATTLELN